MIEYIQAKVKTLLITCFSLLAGLIFTPVTAHASLIINGDFEDTSVNGGRGGWQWYHSSRVDGWRGSNIEIWRDFGAIGAFSGRQHAELNAHRGNGKAFSIFQTFNTKAGSEYDLSFAYGARRSNREAFLVEVIGFDTLFSQKMTDHTVNKWSTLSKRFTADSNQTTLRFTTITPSKATVGNFIDAIRVEEMINVSEPPTLILLSLGVIGLIFSRRKQHR